MKLPTLVAVWLLLGFVTYTTFVAPRPYYATDIDSEQDYYYNARLAADGLQQSVHHPGIPLHELGGLILAVVGNRLEDTQQFFNVAYLLTALASAIAIAVFGRLVMGREPFGTSLLALACILAWPPFLTYLSNFGADSFVVAVGLPTLACFWVCLERPIGRARKALILCGVGLGVGLAVKMTFVPVAAAVVATALVRGWIRSSHKQGLTPRARAALAATWPLFAATVLAYFAATAPIWGRLALAWWRTFRRPDIAPQGEGFPAAVASAIGILIDANPLLAAVVFATTLIAGALVVREWLRAAAARGSNQDTPADGFDFMAGGMLLGILVLGFVYTTAASAAIMPDAEPGVRLRNISPSALFIPLAVAYCARWTRIHGSAGGLQAWGAQAGLAVVAMAILALGITRHLTWRAKFIQDRMQRIEATRSRIDQLADGPRRVAFWTGWDQDYLGPASFHFWGNYRYGNHAFDQQVVQQFPKYAFIRLRNIRQQTEPPAPTIANSKYGKLGDLYWNFLQGLALKDRLAYRRFPDVITGQAQGIEVATIALPTREMKELRWMTVPDLAAYVTDRYGAPRVWTESVAGVEWLFLELPRKGDTSASDRP